MTAADLDPGSIARYIDHTLLRADATRDQILDAARAAARSGFAAFCVQPAWTALAVSELRTTPVRVCVALGFPLGANLATAKRYEAAEVLKLGADEIDMVLNIGAFKSGLDAEVVNDIRGVIDIAHDAKAIVKVILEVSLLTDAEKRRACLLAKSAGADYVKTSTGVGPGGATVEDVRLLRECVGPSMGVKAAGAIRCYDDVLAMIRAGADRVGTSAGVQILREAMTRLGT